MSLSRPPKFSNFDDSRLFQTADTRAFCGLKAPIRPFPRPKLRIFGHGSAELMIFDRFHQFRTSTKPNCRQKHEKPFFDSSLGETIWRKSDLTMTDIRGPAFTLGMFARFKDPSCRLSANSVPIWRFSTISHELQQTNCEGIGLPANIMSRLLGTVTGG